MWLHESEVADKIDIAMSLVPNMKRDTAKRWVVQHWADLHAARTLTDYMWMRWRLSKTHANAAFPPGSLPAAMECVTKEGEEYEWLFHEARRIAWSREALEATPRAVSDPGWHRMGPGITDAELAQVVPCDPDDALESVFLAKAWGLIQHLPGRAVCAFAPSHLMNLAEGMTRADAYAWLRDHKSRVEAFMIRAAELYILSRLGVDDEGAEDVDDAEDDADAAGCDGLGSIEIERA